TVGREWSPAVCFPDLICRVSEGSEVFLAVERDGELRRASGDPFGALPAGAPVPGGLAAARLLPPVMPSKIVCVGLNYKDHAGEEIGRASWTERVEACG